MYLTLKFACTKQDSEFIKKIKDTFHDNVEIYMEDSYNSQKLARQLKGRLGTKLTPCGVFLYKDTEKMYFYSDDNSCTYDNICDKIEEWVRQITPKGIITIEQIEGNQVGRIESGPIQCLLEGFCLMLGNFNRWYRTSIVKKIDWDNKIIETLNSKYSFEIKS